MQELFDLGLICSESSSCDSEAERTMLEGSGCAVAVLAGYPRVNWRAGYDDA